MYKPMHQLDKLILYHIDIGAQYQWGYYPNSKPIIIFVKKSNLDRKKSDAHFRVMRICMFSYTSNIQKFFL